MTVTDLAKHLKAGEDTVGRADDEYEVAVSGESLSAALRRIIESPVPSVA